MLRTLIFLVLLFVTIVFSHHHNAAKKRIKSVRGLFSLPTEEQYKNLTVNSYFKANKAFGPYALLKAMTFPGAYSECVHSNEVALTFDDGPSKYTAQALDILAEEGVIATFFVVGVNVDSRSGRSLVKRMKKEGHSIGSHTYSHPDLTSLSNREIIEQLTMTEGALSDAGIPKPSYFRPPYGSLNERVMSVLHDRGYDSIVLWNVDTNDWKDHSSPGFSLASIYKAELPGIENALILEHDTYEETIDTLRAGIKAIRSLGRSIVPLSRCLYG